jgi:translation initiation factor IF-2
MSLGFAFSQLSFFFQEVHMSANNVANFAAELKMPADVLLQQLKAAGVAQRSVDDSISESDKEHL